MAVDDLRCSHPESHTLIVALLSPAPTAGLRGRCMPHHLQLWPVHAHARCLERFPQGQVRGLRQATANCV